ncbi:MAG: hypothetical protein J6J35_01485 [Alphaproteobacteria bacterium]|nr:hypothetical protein [Alphaproteobacteria bacterium]
MDYLQVSRVERELNDSFDSILRYMKEIKEFALNCPKINTYALERTKITLKLYNYLMSGFGYEESKSLIANEMELPLRFIESKIDAQFSLWQKRIRPHKVYAAQKMAACDIPVKKIAEVLKVTPATVRTYLTIKNVKLASFYK